MLLTACCQQAVAKTRAQLEENHMLTFYGFGSAFGLPDPSPFVMKSEVHLKMAGVPYRFERAAPNTAPKGKIPFIRVGAHRLGDSTFIRAHIEREHRFDFDKGLSLE